MITDETDNLHYLAAKSISGLLRGIISSHNGGLHCLNCFYSQTQQKVNLENMKEYVHS